MYKSVESYRHNRNYHCRISTGSKNGVSVVTLENELVLVTVLPDKGTDIVEFLYKPKDIDFMWHSFNRPRSMDESDITIPSQGGNFLDYYSGGWQELFPSYGSPTTYQNAELGIHGEATLLKWNYEITKDTQEEVTVKFFTRTRRSPYYMEKWLTLKTYDSTLYIEERITNEGSTEQEFIWGHHPALGPVFLDDSCEITVGENATVHVPNIESALQAEDVFSWPKGKGVDGKEIDLSKVRGPEAKKYMEYGVHGLEEGWALVWNQNYNLGFQLNWDIETFPYLWIWEPGGAKEDFPWFGRCYALGVEPWSSPVGDLNKSIEEGTSTKLKGGESITTKLTAKAVIERRS